MTEKFFDRELSTLEFNARVLAEGMDPANPLLERLKFIGIVSSNIDEFFMVRVASLKATGAPLEAIQQKVRVLINRRNDYFLNVLVPDMTAAGLVRMAPASCQAAQLDYLQTYFRREILPIVTPIALWDDRPVPTLANLRIHLMLGLRDPGKGGVKRHAVVEVPHKTLPRLVFLPSEKDHPFVLLEDLIAHFATELFPGYEILESGFFRLTRGAELTFDEEKDEDFMRVMTEALRERRTGDVVRMEASAKQDWAAALARRLGIGDDEIIENTAWLELKTVSQIALQPGFDALKRPAWEPRAVPELEKEDDMWAVLKRTNVLLSHPYETFDAVIRFLEAAAEDPDVLAIKQTLYRTDSDSPILRCLEKAAEKGKRVTALIELKARFDEENNIEWSRRLTAAGATVLYGVAGYKTHAKACLVIRRESDGIRRYLHLSTGNYNERTARIYSDVGFLSGDEALAGDLSAFFNMVTGYSQPADWRKIEVAPFGMRRRLLRLIRRETMRSTEQHPGFIRAKMNSLADPELIDALYQASQAGVRIDLNVRGICRLRPGVKGLSDTIRVVSIVDQFLEHSRIFHFANGGEDEVFLASADWMPRNLDRRIEIMFPVEDPANRRRLMDMLDAYFRDNAKSWLLKPDGAYERSEAGKGKRFRVQEWLSQRAIDDEQSTRRSLPQGLKPQKAQAPVKKEVLGSRL
ncbi:MAG TPA: polyphosphate kinase 1 [Elusimicrobiota bacterium]|nr:polyphosphate kinase 1 [Elusimicrobiota bacterium]